MFVYIYKQINSGAYIPYEWNINVSTPIGFSTRSVQVLVTHLRGPVVSGSPGPWSVLLIREPAASGQRPVGHGGGPREPPQRLPPASGFWYQGAPRYLRSASVLRTPSPQRQPGRGQSPEVA